MKFGFIAKHRSVWPAAWLCEALGVSRSGFHAWLKRGPCARSREDEAIMPAVRASFVASARTYGARRIWRDVLEAGFSCGLHKIERLMRAQALRARPRRRALPKDDGERSGLSDLAECARPPVHGGPAQPQMDCRLQCAAASGVRDGGRSPAIGLQEQVANHRKRLWSKAGVVSVTEKALQRRQVGDRKARPRGRRSSLALPVFQRADLEGRVRVEGRSIADHMTIVSKGSIATQRASASNFTFERIAVVGRTAEMGRTADIPRTGRRHGCARAQFQPSDRAGRSGRVREGRFRTSLNFPSRSRTSFPRRIVAVR